MTDTIVYVNYVLGGGVDGLDPTDKPGSMAGAFLTRTEAEKDRAYSKCVPEVHDLEEVAKSTLNNLNAVQRLAVEHFHKNKYAVSLKRS